MTEDTLEVLTLGRVGVDLYPPEIGLPLSQVKSFDKFLGGSPTNVAVAPFYPLPATRARELCQENGWLSGRSERGFYEGHSVLDMPSLPPANIAQMLDEFTAKLRLGPGGKRRLGRSRSAKLARHPFQYPACDLFAFTRPVG